MRLAPYSEAKTLYWGPSTTILVGGRREAWRLMLVRDPPPPPPKADAEISTQFGLQGLRSPFLEARTKDFRIVGLATNGRRRVRHVSRAEHCRNHRPGAAAPTRGRNWDKIRGPRCES